MLFKILVKKGEVEVEGVLVSLSHENEMIRLRQAFEKDYPASEGYRVWFHPEVKLDAMHETGSFGHLPIEERKK
jgi:hypothetical protein